MAIGYHVPDLDALQKLDNREIQFYAAIGAVVSLAAALDLAYVEYFAKGNGIDRAAAGRVLFVAKSSSLQRDMARAAIENRLAGHDDLLAEWKALYERLLAATGQSGLRHLVAHNTAARTVFSGAFGGAPFGAVPLGAGLEESFSVSQDRQKVLAGKDYKDRTAALPHLLAFSRELMGLLSALKEFLARVP